MSQQNGIFIVLEGADGSGKTTQFNLLSERLKAVGYDVEVFDFPRYEESSSHFVRAYLNGKYGPAAEISPYTASLFYALDRFEAAPAIREALAKGKIVLSNRYVGSNMAHQGGKFTNEVQQRGFFLWEDSLEFELLGLPRPNLNLFLRVPAEVSFELINKKARRGYTDKTHDEHEKNIDHLRQSVSTYDTLCKLFPKDFRPIECTRQGKILSITAINDKIWKVLQPLLPNPTRAGREVVVDLNQTQPQSNNLSDNQQNTTANEDQKITIKIEKISLLALTSIRTYTDIESKFSVDWSAEGSYQYFSPRALSSKVLHRYKESLQKISDLHKQMLDEVSSAAVKMSKSDLGVADNVIPMAALANATISGELSAMQRLISSTALSPYEELRWFSRQLLAQASRQRPNFSKQLKSELKPEINPNQATKIILKLVKNELSTNISANEEPVSLLEAHPRNEFELLPRCLYSYSNLPLNTIKKEIEDWTYEQKAETFNAILEHAPALLLEQARYQWNVITEPATITNLAEELGIQDLQTQPPTPRYGYAVPEIVEKLGLEEPYMECFDESLKLFSAMQAENSEIDAAYSTLLGHKNSWQFACSAANLISGTAKSQSTIEYRELLSEMLEKISEAHPLICSFIQLSEKTGKNTAAKKASSAARQPKSRSSRSKK